MFVLNRWLYIEDYLYVCESRSSTAYGFSDQTAGKCLGHLSRSRQVNDEVIGGLTPENVVSYLNWSLLRAFVMKHFMCPNVIP